MKNYVTFDEVVDTAMPEEEGMQMKNQISVARGTAVTEEEGIQMKNQINGARGTAMPEEEGMQMKNQINVANERKAGKIMRTGIIATSLAAAAGMALSASPETVLADELTEENLTEAVVAETEAGWTEDVSEAEEAVEEARVEADAAEEAANEAEYAVYENEQEVSAASEELENVTNEAEEAFDQAKEEAADADEDAQADVEAAETEVEEAEDKVTQAEEEVALADDALRNAENSFHEAESDCSVSEDEISAKETELNNVLSDIEEAETQVNESQAAVENASADVTEKEGEKEMAETNRETAEREKSEADRQVEMAAEAAETADNELRSAEDLKAGRLDIEETEQYKAEKEAQERVDKANEDVRVLNEEIAQTEEDLEKAEVSESEAEKDWDAAVETLKAKEAEYKDAVKAQAEAADVEEKAQAAYDDAVDQAAEAQEKVTEAESSLNEARDAEAAAVKAKEEADKAVQNDLTVLEKTMQDAETVVDKSIADSEADVAEKKSAVSAAKEALEEAAEKYKQGMLGFIDWMLGKDDLSKVQKQDLQRAREVLEAASEEDFTKWVGGDNTHLPEERNGKVVVIGDEKDATALDNILKSIEVMEKINDLRASDDNYTGDMQRSDSYTNFYFMATAEAGAMRGAGLRRHSSLTTSCENLAYGYDDPTLGWYNKEKAVFDNIKNELGISKISSEADVTRIENEAEARHVVVGHYTNLFYAKNQLMGVGYTQYFKTFCYNASGAANYTDDRYNRGMHLYTVSELGQLVREYYQAVNKENCEKTLVAAEEELNRAENTLQQLTANRDKLIDSAIHDAKEQLAVSESRAEQASQSLADVRNTVAEFSSALDKANAEKFSADHTVSEAEAVLKEATETSVSADTAVEYALEAQKSAKQSAVDAAATLKRAEEWTDELKALLEEKKEALEEAVQNLNSAVAEHAAAEQKLKDLTSDQTIDKLKEQKNLADIALQEATDNQEDKASLAEQAAAAYAEASQEAEEAKTRLQEAQESLSEAVLNRDKLQTEATSLSEEVDQLREDYSSVLQAKAAWDDAVLEVERTGKALQEAEAGLVEAKEKLSDAQAAKTVTANRLLYANSLSVEGAMEEEIEDEGYAYLNTYISSIKKAEDEAETTKSKLADSDRVLLEKKEDSEKAKKKYLALLANLALLQDRGDEAQAETIHPAAQEKTEQQGYVELTVSRRSVKSEPPETVKVSGRTGLTKAKSSGDVFRADPVATGDKSNVMKMMAEFLAGAGLMAVAGRKRKGEKTEER